MLTSLLPNTELVEASGVSGGVCIGTPGTVAATPGIGVTVEIGLFTTAFGAGELPLALTELADEERAGLGGGREVADTRAGESGGGGGADAGLWEPGVEVGLTGVEVGVGVVVGGPGWTMGGPVYFSPSSPGEKMTTLQKPSVDVIRRVRPSGDLFGVRFLL